MRSDSVIYLQILISSQRLEKNMSILDNIIFGGRPGTAAEYLTVDDSW